MVSIQELSANQLLAKLSPADQKQIAEHFAVIPLEFGTILYEAGDEIEYAYFPMQGILSAIVILDDGDGIEAASVGKEGMFGLPVFAEAKRSPYRILIQGAGSALRIPLDKLRDECEGRDRLKEVLNRYQVAFLFQVSRSVACNGVHSIERRCCRWLLISADRMETDDLPLTHEFLAFMLGCRRASVTDVLQTLQQRGLLKTGRGRVHLLDRGAIEAAACECYRAVREEHARLLG